LYAFRDRAPAKDRGMDGMAAIVKTVLFIAPT
jgi:hypothetical protein